MIKEKTKLPNFREARTLLLGLRSKVGPDMAIGHACSNLMEMTENHSKTKDRQQRKQIEMNMDREYERLSGLLSDPH